MTTAVQHRRGTTAEHATFTGLEGEVTIDTTKDTAVIHDGVLAGGVPLARENLANVTPSGLATITGASTASDDKFFIYDQSATTLKSITRAELNNAMEIDALANVTITGGTINGTTIGNTTAAAGTFTQANFADNAKAIFGAGSDLQIYHDGFNSYIDDTATGDLIIRASAIYLQKYTGETLINAVADGAVKLYYDAAQKLATTATGIDVTGTVVADGLTVGNTSAAASQITITSSATGVSSIYFADADPDVGRINYDHSTNALSFVTANTTKVTIDSTGSVGIGTSSPANMLHLSNTSEGTHDLAFNRNTTYGASTGLGGVSWYNQAGDTKLTRIESQTDGAATNTRLIFSTASSGTLAERMRIASNGDISFYEDTGTTAKFFWDASAESLVLGQSSTAGVGEALYVNSGGIFINGENTSINANGLSIGYNTNFATFAVGGTSGASRGMTFGTVSGGVEGVRMTIDSAGNVGIGTSVPSTLLDLRTANGVSSTLRLGSSSSVGVNTTVGTIEFYDADSDDAGIKSSISNLITGNVGPGGEQGGNLLFSTALSGASPTERLRITSAGSVGIGTSSPAYKLDVAGSADVARFDTTSLGGVLFSRANLVGSGSTHYLLQFVNSDSTVAEIKTTNRTGGTASTGTGYELSFAAAGTGYQTWFTNSTERLRLDSAGNLGLGVTPSAWYTTFKAFQFGGNGSSLFGRSENNMASIGSNVYVNAAGSNTYINTNTASYFQQINGAFQWYTAPSGTAGNAISFTQAMTLTAAGDLLVGTTSSSGTNTQGLTVLSSNSGTRLYIGHATGTANGTQYVVFNYAGTNQIGSISQSGTTAVLYNTTSDQRLKENIVDADSASELIDSLQVRQFDWKSENSHQRYGFVAQELVNVAPEAVHQPADPEEMMAVDYSKLVPMLVKEIQSLRKRLADAGI